jgi:hypothetical protein
MGARGAPERGTFGENTIMARRADKRQDAFIQDMGALVAHWQQADPAGFGLSEQQVQTLIDRYHAAHSALRTAERAQRLARARTIEKRERMAELRREFGALSEIIDGVARSTRDAGVYARARIARPGQRAPLPAPPAPTDLEHELRNDGSIGVTFAIEDRGRGGLVYEVQRQLEPIGFFAGDGQPPAFEPMAVIAQKHFLDEDVPEGLRAIRYRVRALRSSGARSGWSTPATVFFGTQKSGTPAPGEHSEASGSKSTRAVG